MTVLAGNELEAAMIPSDSAWTTFAATWTNLTVGSATEDHRYFRVGKSRLIICRWSITLAADSSISGTVSVTYPVAPASNGVSIDGIARYRDVSAPASYHGYIYATSTSVATFLRWAEVHTALSSTVPFTWATGDSLIGQLVYEAAS